MTGDAADSAGRPWSGRAFERNDYAGDDGSAPPGWVDAVAALRAGSGDPAAVLDVLRSARLLVPLVAGLAEAGEGAHGTVDKRAELALPTVAGPDGRAVLPAFSSAEAMRAWDPGARPTPAPARQVALGAASDGTELVIVDPGSTTQFGVRRGAVEALARDLPWTPSWLDPGVLDAVAASADREVRPGALRVDPGDPLCTLDGAEIVVTLAADPASLAAVIDSLRAAWAADPVIARAVDSISVRLPRG